MLQEDLIVSKNNFIFPVEGLDEVRKFCDWVSYVSPVGFKPNKMLLPKRKTQMDFITRASVTLVWPIWTDGWYILRRSVSTGFLVVLECGGRIL